MKSNLIVAVCWLGILGGARASLFYEGDLGAISTAGGTAVGSVPNSGTVADGNPVGLTISMDLTGQGLENSLQSITVSLNVSGGVNSDLYAYLSYNGQIVTLLNRIGVSSSSPFGNMGAGLNVTLDSTSGNIHNTAGGLTFGASYGADGQTISPYSSAASFNLNGNSSVTLNSTFGGMDPNGVWTLYIADTVAGGGDETLNGWSLDIAAVPEPVNLALSLFAGALGIAALRRGFFKTSSRQ